MKHDLLVDEIHVTTLSINFPRSLLISFSSSLMIDICSEQDLYQERTKIREISRSLYGNLLADHQGSSVIRMKMQPPCCEFRVLLDSYIPEIIVVELHFRICYIK